MKITIHCSMCRRARVPEKGLCPNCGHPLLDDDVPDLPETPDTNSRSPEDPDTVGWRLPEERGLQT